MPCRPVKKVVLSRTAMNVMASCDHSVVVPGVVKDSAAAALNRTG